MDHQDWNTVVFRKKHPKTAKDAQRRGLPTGTYKRPNSGKNKQPERKYKEDEDGMPIRKGLPKGFGQRMQKARQAKGFKQKELAQKIGERIQVVQDYERGKVLNVNQGIINKLERCLGKLR